MRKIFISPHNDDETLFGAFTLMEHACDIEVVVVYDSYVQVERGAAYCDRETRRNETRAALQALGVVEPPAFLGLDDRKVDIATVTSALEQFSGCLVYAPQYDLYGNRHHNIVAQAILDAVPKENVINWYMTYTTLGKSTSSWQVVPRMPGHIRRKLVALSQYKSQIMNPECRPHFLRDQNEYMAWKEPFNGRRTLA